ncbi:unnamed protein product [Mytilus coruscus]|uniref:Mutator-like transposase domain-containing protein n=1 Tax=Mytilus coruscus TaxID=42192 RepID=A0A6J8EFK4_MYTCO|nr:unnamed protein product [Mytilus coruscus]
MLLECKEDFNDVLHRLFRRQTDDLAVRISLLLEKQLIAQTGPIATNDFKKANETDLLYHQLKYVSIRSEKNSFRLLRINELEKMWNEVFIEHRQISPMCTGFISWDLSAEQQRGAAWRERTSCNECSYHSKMFNLYNEVVAKKRGRRTAAINLSIQVALNHIAISTTGLQKLFLGSNIPAPSTSSMQHSANVVSEIIEEYNQKDLAQKRKLLKEINILRGDNPNIINIQADGMYNNPFIPEWVKHHFNQLLNVHTTC